MPAHHVLIRLSGSYVHVLAVNETRSPVPLAGHFTDTICIRHAPRLPSQTWQECWKEFDAVQGFLLAELALHSVNMRLQLHKVSALSASSGA